MEVRRSKEGDGHYCWKKQGGCGWTGRVNQPSGKVDNPDLADQKNTVLKMAVKRALVAATITAIHASDMFTQDLEDYRVVVSEPPKPSNTTQNTAVTGAEVSISFKSTASTTTNQHPSPPAPTASSSINWDEVVAQAETVAVEEFVEPGEDPELGNGGYVELLRELKSKKLKVHGVSSWLSGVLNRIVNDLELEQQGFAPETIAIKLMLEAWGAQITAGPDGKPQVTGLTLSRFEAGMNAIAMLAS
jgi:hypothetical protein